MVGRPDWQGGAVAGAGLCSDSGLGLKISAFDLVVIGAGGLVQWVLIYEYPQGLISATGYGAVDGFFPCRSGDLISCDESQVRAFLPRALKGSRHTYRSALCGWSRAEDVLDYIVIVVA